MGLRTALYDEHLAAGARLVDFAGWQLPLAYGSQIDEHHAVRRAAGMFDVSHMAVSDLHGARARDFLRLLLANDVARLKTPGRALYSCMLNARGGVMDDLIVYYLAEWRYRIVSNAATRDKDLAWMRAAAAEFGALKIHERRDLAMIAVQGPQAKDKVYAALGAAVREAAAPLGPFQCVTIGELMIATTGYTGEEGFEIILPASAAAFVWRQLREAGVQPCGLGARDTLRLEAGMNLYGQDMDETTTPLESGLAWTVAFEPEERRFIGREALERQRAEGVARKLVGLVLVDKGVLRRHQRLAFDGLGEGEVTSGSFSPTLGVSIALARVPAAVPFGALGQVWLRPERSAPVRVVKYPFVRHGQACIALPEIQQ